MSLALNQEYEFSHRRGAFRGRLLKADRNVMIVRMSEDYTEMCKYWEKGSTNEVLVRFLAKPPVLPQLELFRK